MGSCSDLATKPEVAAKIDKSEKPEIIKASAAVAVPSVVAIVAGYADEAAAIAREALQLAKTGLAMAKNLLGQLGKIFGQFSTILSLIGLMATQAQLLILNNRVNRLEKDLNFVEGLAANALWKAEGSARAANTAIQKANTAIAKSDDAINKANYATARADQSIDIANNARSAADLARSEANQAKVEARFATADANRASVKADAAIQKANTAIADSNQAKRDANIATTKANTAIQQSNANAQELANLRTEVGQLRQQNELLKSDINGLKVALTAALTKVEQKEDKYIVRRVEKQTITNSADIRDINGNLVGLDSKIGKTVDRASADIIRTVDGKTKADIDRIINLGGGGGISLQGAKDAVFGDLFGNTKVNGQLKDVIGTEVTTQTKALEKMNEKQYTDLKDRIDGIPGVMTGVVTAGVVSTLKPFEGMWRQTAAQTAPAVQAQAAAAGVCSTTQPGGCMNKNILQPMQKNMSDLINAAGTAAAVANNALLTRMSGVLNAVKATTDVIKGTTNATLGIVSHASHGLQAIQNFASAAWKTTQADKILSLANTALNIHNAIMLSNNIGRSMAYIADNVLATFGVKDATTGNAIDVGSLVRNKLNSIINQVLGVTQANALRRQFAAYNRIYQAGANVLYSVRSIMDSAADIAETTGENVSQIGNALKKAGAVRENAYKLMPTDFRSPSRVQRRLEKIGNIADSVEQISSDTLDFTEEVKEMKSNKQEFDLELEKLRTEQTKDSDDKKKESTSNPEHSEEDEIRAIPEEKKK